MVDTKAVREDTMSTEIDFADVTRIERGKVKRLATDTNYVSLYIYMKGQVEPVEVSLFADEEEALEMKEVEGE